MIYKKQARIESSADMLIFGENVENNYYMSQKIHFFAPQN